VENDNFLKCHFFIKVANKNLQRSCALFFSSLALILRTLFPSELVGKREKRTHSLVLYLRPGSAAERADRNPISLSDKAAESNL
jgi:hypothetical protein